MLLRDNEGYFVPEEEINKELTQDKRNIRDSELQKAIIDMSGKGMCDNRRVFKSSEVTYTAQNRKERSLKEYFGFDVDRIRFTDEGRTGYVIVPVHEINRRKLMDRYGSDIFYHNYNSIILIVGSIFCASTHDEYKAFKKLIEDNYDYVRNIINLFKNPDANIEDLTSIIEESAKECKKISSNYGRGGR